MVEGDFFFDQPVKNGQRTNDNIFKIKAGRKDYYTTSCLLDYVCFKNYFKMIAIE